jgi:hypothetical protein
VGVYDDRWFEQRNNLRCTGSVSGAIVRP